MEHQLVSSFSSFCKLCRRTGLKTNKQKRKKTILLHRHLDRNLPQKEQLNKMSGPLTHVLAQNAHFLLLNAGRKFQTGQANCDRIYLRINGILSTVEEKTPGNGKM